MEAKPLEGVKVVDFSWVYVGPLTVKTLADYGAEVIKIGSRIRPEPTGRPAGLLEYNTSRLGVTLNLAHPKGMEVAKRLVAWADIVVENFAGGIMKKMGLGYEELKKVKPDIIMLSSCLQGQTGPHANLPGFGASAVAQSGITSIVGWPDREKPVSLHSYTDFVVPHFNVLAILAALDYRRRTGKGQYIDTSQYETALHFMAPLVLDYAVNHRVASRMGNRLAYAAPHGAYRCRGEDRWCAIAVFTDEEWETFCGVIGNPAWTKEPKFSTLLGRKQNEDELDRLIEGWTTNKAAEDVMTMMQAVGVAAGVLQTVEDLLEHDPQLRYRHFYWELEHPEVGKYQAYRPLFVLSKATCELRRAPLLGEHTEYALKKVLSMSDEEIAELVIEGAIE